MEATTETAVVLGEMAEYHREDAARRRRVLLAEIVGTDDLPEGSSEYRLLPEGKRGETERALRLEPIGDAGRFLESHGPSLVLARQRGVDEAIPWQAAADGVLEPLARRPQSRWVPSDTFMYQADARSHAFADELLAAYAEDGLFGGEDDTPGPQGGASDRAKAFNGAMASVKRARQPRALADVVGELMPAYLSRAERGTSTADVVVCRGEEIDAATRYLGVENGVVDLLELRLLDGPSGEARAALISKRCPTRWNGAGSHADDGLWRRLFGRMSDEVAVYYARILGAAVAGADTFFVVVYGATGGGKTTLKNAVQATLGTAYCVSLKKDSLTSRKNESGAATPDLFDRVSPMRLGFLPEAGNEHFDPEKLKLITGGETERGRALYRMNEERAVTATPVMISNEVPKGWGAEQKATVRRMYAIEVPPIHPDDHDAEMLHAYEGEGDAESLREDLLSMLIHYAHEYLAAGRTLPEPPEEVKAAMERAIVESIGPCGGWLMEHTEKTGDEFDRLIVDTLWDALRDAAREDGEYHEKDGGKPERCWDKDRQGAVKFVRSHHGLDVTKTYKVDGKVKRGWTGVRLVGC